MEGALFRITEAQTQMAGISFLEGGVRYQILRFAVGYCNKQQAAECQLMQRTGPFVDHCVGFHCLLFVLTSSICPVHILEIRVYGGICVFHLHALRTAWVAGTLPGAAGEGPTFVLFCFVYLLDGVRWDKSDQGPWCCKHRGLFRIGSAKGHYLVWFYW